MGHNSFLTSWPLRQHRPLNHSGDTWLGASAGPFYSPCSNRSVSLERSQGRALPGPAPPYGTAESAPGPTGAVSSGRRPQRPRTPAWVYPEGPMPTPLPRSTKEPGTPHPRPTHHRTKCVLPGLLPLNQTLTSSPQFLGDDISQENAASL